MVLQGSEAGKDLAHGRIAQIRRLNDYAPFVRCVRAASGESEPLQSLHTTPVRVLFDIPDSLARECDSFGPHTHNTHRTVNPEKESP